MPALGEAGAAAAAPGTVAGRTQDGAHSPMDAGGGCSLGVGYWRITNPPALCTHAPESAATRQAWPDAAACALSGQLRWVVLSRPSGAARMGGQHGAAGAAPARSPSVAGLFAAPTASCSAPCLPA